MGVKGLTTFIATRSRDYYEDFSLHDMHVVLDGLSISSQLYNWHCKRNDCFGGDYDKFANVVQNFFQLLAKCRVTPLVVLDGGYEKRKLKTVHQRIKCRIQNAQALNPTTEGSSGIVFPLFVHYVFIDVCTRMGVKCLRTEFEGDGEAAYLARSLKCPIISYDSDFYIFDVIYIPFNTVELTARKLGNSYHVQCQVYRVDKFLNSFGGLDKVNLPVLSMLLGNDYVHRSCFGAFYQQIKLQKCKGSEQQKRIKSVIMWLQNQTPESAISHILSKFKARHRRVIAAKIQDTMKSYNISNPRILEYFKIDPKIQIQSKPIEIDVDEEPEEGELCSSGEEVVSSSDDELLAEEVEESKYSEIFKNVSRDFRSNFQKCLYPACFIDMLVRHTYYSTPQVEDFSEPDHSHTISLSILSTMHRILNFPSKRPLSCVARDENARVKKSVIPQDLAHDLPALRIIEEADLESRKLMLLQVLECPADIEIFLNKFPQSWHLFLLSVRYWIIKSGNCDTAHVYALILCAIIVNFVDPKIGKFYRSTRQFTRVFGTDEADPNKAKRQKIEENRIIEAIQLINRDESVACLRKLVDYFQMDPKMRTYARLFRRDVVHKFAVFQSCALHIKFLNSLLNSPFPSLFISDFYDGTFLHNMMCNLMKRSSLEAYVKTLLGDCPAILNALELIVSEIREVVGSESLANQNVKKSRKKKKSSKKSETDTVEPMEESGDNSEPGEPYDLGTNRFSLLLSSVK